MIHTFEPLEVIPKPHRWYYDDRRRRRHVRVCIMKFYGVGHHYHISIEEDDDAVWDSRDAASWGRPGEPCGWTQPRGNPRGGRRFDFKRNYYDAAARAALLILRREFPRRTHEWSLDNLTEEGSKSRRWFYGEGD